MVVLGKDYNSRRKVQPTKNEFKLAPDQFIYCSNGDCGLAGSGICRIHLGNNTESQCRHCKAKFPAKPNGKTFGGLHHKALLENGGSPKPQRIYLGNGGGNSNGNKGRAKDGSLEQTLKTLAASMEGVHRMLAGGTIEAGQYPGLRAANNGRGNQGQGKGGDNTPGATSLSSTSHFAFKYQ